MILIQELKRLWRFDEKAAFAAFFILCAQHGRMPAGESPAVS